MLNKLQKAVISIGILLIVCSGIFVPYEGEVLEEGDNPKLFMGYYFLFNPPTKGQVFKDMYGGELKQNAYPGSYENFNTHIVTSAVWIELAVIILVTIGLVILFQQNKQTVPNE
ncbi:MAG: hypothetical protein U5K69_24835 [Balneolaceae bacterium]|nr:hypothetical protein [Balneolaceae bacterium]